MMRRMVNRLGRVPETAWDVAVHIGERRDSALAAHRLAPNDRVVCASPAFVARHGAPSEPARLRDVQCIALRENDEDVTLWRFLHPTREPETVRIHPTLCSNDGAVVREWAMAGQGIAIRSEWNIAADLADRRLKRVLPAWEVPAADVVAMLGTRAGRSARTTAFLALLRESLSPPPWRRKSPR